MAGGINYEKFIAIMDDRLKAIEYERQRATVKLVELEREEAEVRGAMEQAKYQLRLLEGDIFDGE